MKFIRTKALMLVMFVMSLLCLIALGISVSVTITAVKKKDLVVKNMPSAVTTEVQAAAKPARANRFKEQVLYFNGSVNEEVNAYVTDNNQIFIALDDVLDKLGIQYKLYSSDDYLEAAISGKKLLVKIGKQSFSFGNREISLPALPVTAKNHILVPLEFFKDIDGFGFGAYIDKGKAFLNYHAGSHMQKFNESRALRILDNRLFITDILGIRKFWVGGSSSYEKPEFERSADGQTYLLKYQNKVSLMHADRKSLPKILDASPLSHLSLDGKYLYWIDFGKSTSYVYSIRSKSIIELGDYYSRSRLQDAKGYAAYTGSVLCDFKVWGNNRRIALTNQISDVYYAFIEKNGQVTFENPVYFSPDMKQILYYTPEKGYCMANSDGSEVSVLGYGTQAQWINNDAVFLYGDGGSFIFTKGGKSKAETASYWKMVGKAQNGAVFYTDGKSLFFEKGEVESKIMELPMECDHIYAKTENGPYIAVAGGGHDGVYYLDGKRTASLGRSSSLLKKATYKLFDTDYWHGVAISEDNKEFALLHTEDGFLAVRLMKSQERYPREIVLNFRVNSSNKIDKVQLKWLADGILLVFTENQGWLIDVKEDTQVYNWVEPQESTIFDIIP